MALVNFEKQSGKVQMVRSTMRASVVCLLIFASIGIANAQDPTPPAHQHAAGSNAHESPESTTPVRGLHGAIPRATETPVLIVDGPCTGPGTKSASKSCTAVV